MAPEHQQANCGLTRTRPTLESFSLPTRRVHVRRVGTPPRVIGAPREHRMQEGDAALTAAHASHSDRPAGGQGRCVQQHHPLPRACVAVAERCDGGAHERSLRCIGGQWAVGCAERRRQHTALRVPRAADAEWRAELSADGGAARSEAEGRSRLVQSGGGCGAAAGGGGVTRNARWRSCRSSGVSLRIQWRSELPLRSAWCVRRAWVRAECVGACGVRRCVRSAWVCADEG
jgi:hypothetical protein